MCLFVQFSDGWRVNPEFGLRACVLLEFGFHFPMGPKGMCQMPLVRAD